MVDFDLGDYITEAIRNKWGRRLVLFVAWSTIPIKTGWDNVSSIGGLLCIIAIAIAAVTLHNFDDDWDELTPSEGVRRSTICDNTIVVSTIGLLIFAIVGFTTIL